jgi:hypothetical protein
MRVSSGILVDAPGLVFAALGLSDAAIVDTRASLWAAAELGRDGI